MFARSKVRSVAGALAASLLLGAASPAFADDAEPTKRGSPYRIRWGYDAALVGLGAAGTMTVLVGHPKPPCHPGCVPPQGMLGIDDASVGNYSPSALGLANVVVAGLILAPLIIDAADSRFEGWAEDSFVFLQTILMTQALTQITKSAVSRPAPLVYNPNAGQEHLDSPDAFRSYFSGHTATSFAAATAYTYTFWKRHPNSPWRFVVLGASHALALGAGMLKIKAGYHYATDVAAGALVGSAMGVLVPMLHTEW